MKSVDMDSRTATFKGLFAKFCATYKQHFPFAYSPLIDHTEELEGDPICHTTSKFYEVPYIDLVGLNVEDKEDPDTPSPPVAAAHNVAGEATPDAPSTGGGAAAAPPTASSTLSTVAIAASPTTTPACTFFRRDEVTTIWEEIDALASSRQKIAFFQGQPGTGKSTAVWRKVLDYALAGDNVLWVTLGRKGTPKGVVYFQGNFAFQLNFSNDMVEKFITFCAESSGSLPLNTIVVDGMSQTQAALSLQTNVKFWVQRAKAMKESRRAILTASTKVERERPHQNKLVKYITIHSWTTREYFNALISENKFSPLYYSCKHLFPDLSLEEDGDSDGGEEEEGSEEAKPEDAELMEVNANADAMITENDDMMAIDQVPKETEGSHDADIPSASAGGVKDATGDPKAEIPEQVTPAHDPMTLSNEDQEEIWQIIGIRFKYTGGSARWMFNYHNATIEGYLKDYLKSIDNRNAVLDGAFGPTSSASSNYFFGSHKNNDGETEYFLVSQRAVELLLEVTEGQSFQTFYAFARKLQNPAFMGWLVEANFFKQLREQSSQKKSVALTPKEQQFLPAEKIIKFDHTMNQKRMLALQSKTAMKKTKNKRQEKVNQIARELIPSKGGVSVACEPVLWSQGGYDVFFVEAPNGPDGKNIQIRFGQITKGEAHYFKGGFMFSVIQFFQAAGYTVDAVGFTFILLAENYDEFKISEKEGWQFLDKYNRYGMTIKWRSDKLEECVSKCWMKCARKDVRMPDT